MPADPPISIDPCPLIDALVEVRFDPAVQPEAVFGILLTKLSHKFPKVVPLQPAILPEEMRKLNPALFFQPQFRLEGEKFAALIGPNVFAVAMLGQYPGWKVLSNEFRQTLRVVHESQVIKTTSRFALHYVNYFDRNILPQLTLSVTIDAEPVNGESTVFKTILQGDGYRLQLQVVTDLKVSTNNPSLGVDPNVLGSLIDIDCFIDYPTVGEDFLGSLGSFMESAHAAEKKLFFDLLADEFLKTLNPKYADSSSNGQDK